MNEAFRDDVESRLAEIRSAGTYKSERIIGSRQGARVLAGHAESGPARRVINLCANNYLGLAGEQALVDAARDAADRWGFGTASVRFICGTQQVHRELEARIAAFLGADASILYGSCFDANAGLFETLLTEQDAIISDELNHASIIDGIRLCKARRYRYANCNAADLRERLRQADADGARHKLIFTDGVFSMDGHVAPLADICQLADEFDALVGIDECHATGFFGPGGRGTPAHHGVEGRVDIITSTLGKALGGASGGFTASHACIVDLLRQRSRPYLFSNAVAPMIAGATLRVLDLVERGEDLRARLMDNTRRFRQGIRGIGLDIVDGEHPIVPVMFYDERTAGAFAERLLAHGVYVIAFSFPVVPKGKARIRCQMSAALAPEDIDEAVSAFAAVRDELGLPARTG